MKKRVLIVCEGKNNDFRGVMEVDEASQISAAIQTIASEAQKDITKKVTIFLAEEGYGQHHLKVMLRASDPRNARGEIITEDGKTHIDISCQGVHLATCQLEELFSFKLPGVEESQELDVDNSAPPAEETTESESVEDELGGGQGQKSLFSGIM